jgi:hypothetical protein
MDYWSLCLDGLLDTNYLDVRPPNPAALAVYSILFFANKKWAVGDLDLGNRHLEKLDIWQQGVGFYFSSLKVKNKTSSHGEPRYAACAVDERHHGEAACVHVVSCDDGGYRRPRKQQERCGG